MDGMMDGKSLRVRAGRPVGAVVTIGAGAVLGALSVLSVLAGCGGAVPDPSAASPPADHSERREAVRAARGLLPDIREQIPFHLHIWNQQGREELRFTTSHANTGEGKLQIRGGVVDTGPCTIEGVSYAQCTASTQEILDADGNVVDTHPAGVAVFHESHNHWHQNDVARFEIRAGSLDGEVVAGGNKTTFCLIDYEPLFDTQTSKTRTYFACNADLQGITPGWADQYHHSTEGQSLPATGLPEGIYYLTHFANPAGNWIESDTTNNSAWVKFFLNRSSGENPDVEVLDTSPCDFDTCSKGTNR